VSPRRPSSTRSSAKGSSRSSPPHGSGSAHGRGLPAFVERELRAYLDCGILARGFARVRCPDCGFERLVAFSCKARVCPSCNARRMEDAAEHLVKNVFPNVPVRQWVLSLPRRVGFLAARHPALVSRLLDLFTRAVFAWPRRSVRRLGVPNRGPGASPRSSGSAVPSTSTPTSTP
jgi:hypothetical protein